MSDVRVGFGRLSRGMTMGSRAFIMAASVLILAAIGCADTTDKSSGISADATTLAAFNTAGAPTVAFSVPDMMCAEGCGAKVKEILSEQPGVKDVLVEFDTKTATVAVDESTFDADAAIAALVDHQFEHSTLQGAGEP
jgi:copper chaperone CopZ